MTTDFHLVALSREKFQHLFSMNDEELATHNALRMVVDKKPGYPCRVSLMDAEPGERVILLPFKHHNVDSPYQSTGPIFIREAARTAAPKINEIPVMFHYRLHSVRAYNENAMMVSAKVVEGQALEATIQEFFTDSNVAYLQLHNAGPGCFNCLVQRA